MGLDQYAYVATNAGMHESYYSDENYDKEEDDPTKIAEPRELASWRKHPNLQGWMERLWVEKNPGADEETGYMFNGVELELTWEDLDRLEADVIAGQLPDTKGFFFGNNADDYYRESDLKFIREAKAEVFLGLRVFYNSSW